MNKKVLAASILSILMILGMSSCGNGFDAYTYVKSSLDAVQTGAVSDELASISKESKEELQEDIDKLREDIEQSLLDALGDEEKYISDDAKDSIKSAADGLFEKMKYEVSEDVTRDGDDYTVTVNAYPMNCIDDFADWLQGDFVSEWTEKAGNYTSTDKLLKDMYAACFEKLDDLVQNTESGDPREMKVHISPDEDGVYQPDAEDIESLVMTLLGTSQLTDLAE